MSRGLIDETATVEVLLSENEERRGKSVVPRTNIIRSENSHRKLVEEKSLLV